MNKSIDITGCRFNKLLAVSLYISNNSGNQKWLFRCDCGIEKVILKSHVKNGHTKSCGCYNRNIITKRNLKHNHSKRSGKSETYKIWNGVKNRCLNIKQSNYSRYGGRGIKVCERWLNSFENFLEDMGERPSPKHSIDRINNDGNYEPSNCRWANKEQQDNNKRNSIKILIDNKNQTLPQWCKELKLNYVSTYKKIKASNNKNYEHILL